MSEHGGKFHQRDYIGRRDSAGANNKAETHYLEQTDLQAFLTTWRELTDTSEEDDPSAQEALTTLVDSLDADEYVALVRKIIDDVVGYPPPQLLNDGFCLSGTQGDFALMPDGAFVRRMGDRRTLHRLIALLPDEFEEAFDVHHVVAIDLEGFDPGDYDYGHKLPETKVEGAYYADLDEVNEQTLVRNVARLAAESGISVLDTDTIITERLSHEQLQVKTEALKELLEYVYARLSEEDRLLYTKVLDRFFEDLTGGVTEDGERVYEPFLRKYMLGQSWEQVDAEDSSPSIYQVVGNINDLPGHVAEGIRESEDRLHEDGEILQDFLRVFGLRAECDALKDRGKPVTDEVMEEIRAHESHFRLIFQEMNDRRFARQGNSILRSGTTGNITDTERLVLSLINNAPPVDDLWIALSPRTFIAWNMWFEELQRRAGIPAPNHGITEQLLMGSFGYTHSEVTREEGAEEEAESSV